MSPLFPDRLLASLAPDEVAIARLSGTLKPRFVARQIVECDPTFGAEPWQGAVAALAATVGSMKTGRQDVTVVLSNHFVRYLTVPHDPAITGVTEELALARFHFSKVYGERAKAWEVRLSRSMPGSPRVASAIDAALLEALRAAFPAGAAARLVSVQPYLMSAFNQWSGVLGKDDGWLLLVERRRACLALICAGGCASVHSARGDFDSSERWADLLDRQQMRVGAASAPRKVLVHAPAYRKPIAEETQGWSFRGLLPRPLEGFLPLEDGPYGMALSSR